jgi:hypothetical protein
MTAARLDRIAELWRAGKTQTEIADEVSATASVVAGLVGRARRRGDLRFGPRPAPPPRVREIRPGAPGVGNRRPLPSVAPPAAVSLLALGYGMCRWPTNDALPGQMAERLEFCGRPVEAPNASYCLEHAQRGSAPLRRL